MDYFEYDHPAPRGGGSGAALSITALTQYLTTLVRQDDILQDVWVRGELSNFTRAGSGHLYFSLKDDEACISCVMWRSAALRLRFRPAPGVQVIAHGQLDVYQQRGQYQLVVDRLVSDGAGSRHVALERSKARLLVEGLLSPERKRPLPPFPSRVAVVTSLYGAAVRDICVTLRSRPHPPDVVLVDAIVQGDDAESSICAALARANQRTGADVIILARGGGSLEDLWSFNSERVARAIAASRVPVVAGVGHETDLTLADLAADLRAPTPTAAAELIAGKRDELIERAAAAVRRAQFITEGRVQRARLKLDGLERRSPLAQPTWMIERRRQEVDELQARLGRLPDQCLSRWGHRLALAAGKLQGLSPLATLSRGYSLATRLPEGAPITSRSAVQPGDMMRVRFSDGSVDARVTDTTNE